MDFGGVLGVGTCGGSCTKLNSLASVSVWWLYGSVGVSMVPGMFVCGVNLHTKWLESIQGLVEWLGVVVWGMAAVGGELTVGCAGRVGLGIAAGGGGKGRGLLSLILELGVAGGEVWGLGLAAGGMGKGSKLVLVLLELGGAGGEVCRGMVVAARARARARVRGRVGASGSMSMGMEALLPRDDPAPFCFEMVGVTSIHLLAAEVYWTGLALPFFLLFFCLVILCFWLRV